MHILPSARLAAVVLCCGVMERPPTVPCRTTCVRALAASQPEGEPAAAPMQSYDDAEQRGFELYQSGQYDRAIRMFELAQTLPGEGVDLKRVKQGGMIGSATAPPNPREWAEDRFATAEQKLIAQYNIACCCAAMGDKPRAMELLRAYASKVGEPLNQVNEMLLDDDLVSVREDLRQLREEYKVRSAAHLNADQPTLPSTPIATHSYSAPVVFPRGFLMRPQSQSNPGLFGMRNPLKEISAKVGVEWKD